MDERFIYWLDELGVEHNNLVGKKCANLGEMIRAGMPVPIGFALTLGAYTNFLSHSGTLNKIEQFLHTFYANPTDLTDMPKYEEASRVIRQIVESATIPNDMMDMITLYYDKLCQRTGCPNTPMAIRSAGPVSHPGQYETYLNVRGISQVMKMIMRVWSSTFNVRSLVWRAREGLSLQSDPIGVAVLEMVNAKAAGVMFTLNPLNGDPSKIIVGGNWGLGESVVSGVTQTDEWVVDKVTLEIVRRKLALKASEYIIDKTTGEIKLIESPRDRREALCLSDDEVIQLSSLAKKLEQHFNKPQDIEWAIAREPPLPESVFLLQTRQETVWSQKEMKLKMVDKEKPRRLFKIL